MPMLITVVIVSPVAPRQVPERTCSAKPAIASSTVWTSGTTSAPSTGSVADRGSRRAVCSTARSSVLLMRSPASIASRRDSTPAARARSSSNATVVSVMRCLL